MRTCPSYSSNHRARPVERRVRHGNIAEHVRLTLLVAYTAEQVPIINGIVDFVNVMTYDLMNRRDNVTTHRKLVVLSRLPLHHTRDKRLSDIIFIAEFPSGLSSSGVTLGSNF